MTPINAPDKKLVIDHLEQAHQVMEEVLSQLTDEQIRSAIIYDPWTTKDIIAHLSAWNWECADEIVRILNDSATWYKSYTSEAGESVFNQEQTQERKKVSVTEVLEEWEESFQNLISTVKRLSQSQWTHQSSNHFWPAGDNLNTQPVTVFSLFDYEYAGDFHEAGHARQIEDILL
jgi:hypothetical protein